MNVERIPIANLSQDPANARVHPERNLAAITASLRRFGQQTPIVIDKSNVVRKGNGTLHAAIAMGWDSIDCIRTELTSSDAIAYAIADNRTSELAEWDDDILAAQLQGLLTEDEELLDAAGFDEDELEALLGELDDDDTTGEIIEDEVPEPPVDPITKPGDLWIIGRHRVLCGDSTKAECWDRLSLEESGGICFTSPPYNLGESQKLSGNKKAATRGNAYIGHDDNRSEQNWIESADKVFELAIERCDAVIWNVQPLAGNRMSLFKWLAGSKCFRDIVTWDKGHAQPAMAGGVLDSRFEWLCVFGKGAQTRKIPLSSWRGTVQNVYFAPGQRKNEFASVHAATFPVHLPAWGMSTLCNLAKWCVDPYLGSGTTLIAAEQLGRTCYGMEISPQYCDVIVKRWENLTGEKAVCQSKTPD
jgi:DNA modification methylase